MAVIAGVRFRSQEICVEPGRYEFDGYLDGSSAELPALEEMEIELEEGRPFPAIGRRRRPCFWQLIDGARDGDARVGGLASIG